MNLKPIKVLQAAEIQDLFSKLVRQVSKINLAYMNWSKESIQQAVEKYQFRFLFSELGEAQTMICYQQNFEFTEILALGTLEKYQRQGFSEKLLRLFIAECGSTSKLLTLEVHAKNDQAIALYHKCGFKTVRIRKNYYSDQMDALVMDLVLNL